MTADVQLRAVTGEPQPETATPPLPPVPMPPTRSAASLDRLWRPGRRAALVLAVLLGGAALAGSLVGERASDVDPRGRLEPPVGFGGTWEHPLGTDGLGRDVLAGVLAGAKTSLIVGLAATAVAAVVGVTLGLAAGYRGGVADALLSWTVDLQLAFPGLLLVLLIAAYVSSGLVPLIFTLALVSWIVFAQMARNLALSLRESEFVDAARLSGTRSVRIMRRHLLPQMASPLLTVALLEIARLMLAEAGLSYLGLGVEPPELSWGVLIADGQQYLRLAWWVVIFPGAALMLSVYVFNQLSRSTHHGEALYRRWRRR